jgi:xylan 1,4-beta-xylosidase
MGYRTLDTKHGFLKPILNGYKLLSKMASDLSPVLEVNNEHITAFASHDKNRITIMVTNYQHEHPYNDGATYPVALKIKTGWKPTAKIKVNHWRIDENHSNAYTVFKSLGSPKLPNPLEIDAIKNRMDLELMEPATEVMAKDLNNMEFEMPCNAVSLIEIIRN